MQENMVGQNIVITERIGTLRQLGRNALRGKWKPAILAFVIYFLCYQIPVQIFNGLFGYNPGNVLTNEGYTYNVDPEVYSQMYNQLPQTSLLSCIYIILISGAFALGISLFFLASFRGHQVGPKDVFLGFERFGKALGLMVFMSLFIFLWSLLFIIPGIIAAIRYSQAFFVLADDPEKGIRECMNESKMMMKGNKAKYFLLGLSFIGWALLAGIPGGIVSGIASVMSDSALATGVAAVITQLFMAPVMAYLYSTYAGFYEILAGHLIKETRPAPISPEQIHVEAPLEQIEAVIESVESTDGEPAKAGGADAEKKGNALEAPEAEIEEPSDTIAGVKMKTVKKPDDELDEFRELINKSNEKKDN